LSSGPLGGQGELSIRTAPHIACPTWRELDIYCARHGLDSRQAPWIWETRHLNGLRGQVVLIMSITPFVIGFMDALLAREADGLIEVDRVCLDQAGSRSS
jgi:hypothetical protein